MYVIVLIAYRSMSTDQLVCDCRVSWLPAWLDQRGLTRSINAHCALPLSLRAENIFSVNLEDFTCEGWLIFPIIITCEGWLIFPIDWDSLFPSLLTEAFNEVCLMEKQLSEASA